VKTSYAVEKISSERLTVELQFKYVEEQLILFFLIPRSLSQWVWKLSSNSSFVFCFLFLPTHQSV